MPRKDEQSKQHYWQCPRRPAERAKHGSIREVAIFEQCAEQGARRTDQASLTRCHERFGKERDRERAELQDLRAQLQAAIRQTAVDSARADPLRNELDKREAEAKARSEGVSQPGADAKRRRKGSGTTTGA